MSDQAPPALQRNYIADRPKAFIDAVVAIAMTLLILPLMESVSDAASSGETTWDWLLQHNAQLISFALSFVIIAMFWLNHHRLFADVHRVNTRLMWLLVAWMFSIVWLPVATAISSQMPANDPVAKSIYIGSMITTSVVALATRALLSRHPELHAVPSQEFREGIADDLALVVLFALALALCLLIPAAGYYPMLVMFASRPTQLLFMKLIGTRKRA